MNNMKQIQRPETIKTTIYDTEINKDVPITAVLHGKIYVFSFKEFQVEKEKMKVEKKIVKVKEEKVEKKKAPKAKVAKVKKEVKEEKVEKKKTPKKTTMLSLLLRKKAKK